MIGSFLSAASCFWQPARSNAAAQTHIAEAIGNDKRLEVLTDGGETNDVAFLLMGSPSRGLLILADVRRIIDPRKKETGLVRVSPDWLRPGSSRRRPNRPPVVPT
ncbi:hypothetical protein MesoLj131b_00460 [Mesorhizobium sp. 131-2-5]|nr:hypothetical protein MesoLj131b_00460 [Mesorhizobium sp. 131-2-5]